MGSKAVLMNSHTDAYMRAQQEVEGADRLLKTWLTTRNRPWVHDAAKGVYIRTRVPAAPFDNELIASRLMALLGSVGVGLITVEHDVDGAALRLTIPDNQPIGAIEGLATNAASLRIHEQTGRGGR